MQVTGIYIGSGNGLVHARCTPAGLHAQLARSSWETCAARCSAMP
jgi:hypothetical protein